MKKLMMIAAAAVAVSAVTAAPTDQSVRRVKQNPVPEKLDESIRPFYPMAATRPHVVLVNVNHAIPDDIWPLVTTYAVSRLQINVWTNQLPAAVLSLLRRPSAPSVRGGDIDPEVLRRLEASGLDVEAISDLLSQRRRINEEYRRKIEADVKRGALTRKAADEMLQAAGLGREGNAR